ncbi:alpha/beta fold hydrolase [Methanobacterium alcaliphilum]|uniref:alpha/beta fold hydrolase n=1 Tax=Methanobacterium alcaliphilum TaxID=392018 RepID=UPI00200AFA22|nr:alpha/beta fold hydrolase [Methanobacterium alcaliphilum]MCK9151398.1 alpha/beta fold hydrolase [Methanobacterium alcaliphilum]
MSLKTNFNFPVGYHDFHEDKVFNYQMNRWYSMGYAREEDLKEAALKIKNFNDWKREMIQQAEKAVSEDRLINAAFYYRAAEFYLIYNDSEKEKFYDKFINLFYRAFASDSIERFKVPFANKFLPALKVPAQIDSGEKKGTIVIHGGFDSFIEEFYSWMRYFAAQGYDVIAFEGPGQGAALKKYKLPFDWQWEKPASAILDYFQLDDVTWLGISMGGWLCFRAAALEPRIKRVIASSVAYDYMKFPNYFAQLLGKLFFHHFRNYSNKVSLKQIEKGGIDGWSISNLMYITVKKTPMAAVDVAEKMNGKNIHSEMVKQDVLILTGREDHFIPFKMHNMQIKALNNTNSLTARVFTREDQAQNHCQVGNIKLALETMLKWIGEHTDH